MTSSPAGTHNQLITMLRNGDLNGEWTLDPTRSSVALRSKSIWGLVKVTGTFTEIAGEGKVDADGTVTGSITVTAVSIDTKRKKRDAHLRSADFFDVENHPTIVFTAHRLAATADGAVINGDLTVHGVTRPLTVPVSATRSEAGLTLAGEVTIDRSEFGLTWNQLGMTSMSNHINVTATFTRQQ